MRTSLVLAFAALLVAVTGCAPADVAIGAPCTTSCPEGYWCSTQWRCELYTDAEDRAACERRPPRAETGTCYVACSGRADMVGECDWLARDEGVASCDPTTAACTVRCTDDNDCPAPLHCSTRSFGDCVR